MKAVLLDFVLIDLTRDDFSVLFLQSLELYSHLMDAVPLPL